MTTVYVFDVDGTLTPSRGRIADEFRLQFIDFCSKNTVVLITGSDRQKTIEQLGVDVVDDYVYQCFNCAGNEVWQNGSLIFTNQLDWLEGNRFNEIMSLFESELEHSNFHFKTGNHVEVRDSLINFSIVGRNCDKTQRNIYVEYDQETQERSKIRDRLNPKLRKFNLIATVAGETGLDITEIGKDKRQLLDWYNDVDIVFFGDKMKPSGNDFPLAYQLLNRNANDSAYHVTSWQVTSQILKDLTSTL